MNWFKWHQKYTKKSRICYPTYINLNFNNNINIATPAKAVYLMKAAVSKDKKRSLSVQHEAKFDTIKNKRLTVKRLQCKLEYQRREASTSKNVSMQNIEEEKSAEGHKSEIDE